MFTAKKVYQTGFTLVEMMIVVAIAAILFAVALPAYQDQVRSTKRSDGKGFLMELQAAQERYFTQNVTYGTLAELGYADNVSPEGYYTIAITPADPDTTFTLSATPAAPFTDDECNVLTLTHTGLQGSDGPDDCWN